MKFLHTLYQQLENEAVTTRKMLSRIPDDAYSWKPHLKSMDIKTLANHIAELPGWIAFTMDQDELDFAKTPYQPRNNTDGASLLAFFEEMIEKGLKDLSQANEADLHKTWTLREGEIIYTQAPKMEMLRMTVSQIIHHRAQLGVYLRMLDVPIPGSYGPSADEA
jgi:uncharacterized damage-inducible protein DinB